MIKYSTGHKSRTIASPMTLHTIMASPLCRLYSTLPVRTGTFLSTPTHLTYEDCILSWHHLCVDSNLPCLWGLAPFYPLQLTSPMRTAYYHVITFVSTLIYLACEDWHLFIHSNSPHLWHCILSWQHLCVDSNLPYLWRLAPFYPLQLTSPMTLHTIMASPLCRL